MRFKDHAQFAEGELLAQLLGQALRTKQQSEALADRLLPVPLHSRRLRQRGFNQSQQIAKQIEHQCQIPILNNACYRHRDTTTQRGLHLRERQRNLRDAFSIDARALPKLADKRIAIVDDVVTTSSTVNTLAKLFKDNGARTVHVYCLARVGKPNF